LPEAEHEVVEIGLDGLEIARGEEHSWNSIIDAVRGAGSVIGAADLILGLAVDKSDASWRSVAATCRSWTTLTSTRTKCLRRGPDRRSRQDAMLLFSQAPEKPKPEKPVGRKWHAPTQRALDAVTPWGAVNTITAAAGAFPRGQRRPPIF
jgi:hypothetical protein